MEDSYETPRNGEVNNHELKIPRYPSYHQPSTRLSSSSWFNLRVFYVRISNFKVDDSAPEFLNLSHIPLNPDTLLEINGVQMGIYSGGVTSLLRRDRVDKKPKEATFISTDYIRFTGSVKFEVYHKEDMILSGVLEHSGSNDFAEGSNCDLKRWNMFCEAETSAGPGFLRGKHIGGPKLSPLPIIEVYVAGCFTGSPIILTKTLQLGFRKKHSRKSGLELIPENETDEAEKDGPTGLQMQVAKYRKYKQDYEEEYCSKMYWRTEFMDCEDGEMSWFNAGLRVGLGIGLGICVGLGIGVGLLVRTYQATARNFRRRLP